jgi:hypothetical protein
MDLQPLSVRDAVPSLQAIAAQTVQNLADHPTHNNLDTLVNGIPLFLHLLGGSSSSNSSSSEQHLTRCAAAVLCTLASNDSAPSIMLGAACGVNLLRTISNSSSSGSISAATTPAAIAAAEVLACLALHEDSRAAIAQAGGMATLLGIIQVVLDYDNSVNTAQSACQGAATYSAGLLAAATAIPLMMTFHQGWSMTTQRLMCCCRQQLISWICMQHQRQSQQ